MRRLTFLFLFLWVFSLFSSAKSDLPNIPTYPNLPPDLGIDIEIPPEITQFWSLRLPLTHQLSYYYAPSHGDELSVWDDGFIHIPLQREFTYRGGAFISFDFNRISGIDPSKVFKAYLYLISPFPLNNVVPYVHLYRLNVPFDEYSLNPSCRYRAVCQHNPCYCYQSPEDISKTLLANYTPYPVNEDFPTVSLKHPSWAGGKDVLIFDISSFIADLLAHPYGLFVNFSAEGPDFFTFYGKVAPSPALESFILIFGSGDLNVSWACGDGICDPFEINHCEDDCGLPDDLDAPIISLNLNPNVDTIGASIYLSLSASAQDPNGIARIRLYNKIDGSEIKVCTNQTTCSLVVQAGNLGLGEHKICAIAEDTSGNPSQELCHDLWIGSKTYPQVTVSNIPSSLHLGQELRAHLRATDTENLKEVRVSVGVEGDFDAFYDHTFQPNNRLWEQNLTVPICRIPFFETDKVILYVVAKDEEGLTKTERREISLIAPIQTRYGFKPKNRGQSLYYSHYRKTFGDDEVYSTISFCVGIPILFECYDNVFCDCYIGSPGSTLSEVIHGLFDWIIEGILDVIDIEDDIYNYFGISSLDELGIPSPEALLFYPIYHIAADQGDCTGFTMASSHLITGHKRVQDICPRCGSTISFGDWDDIRFYLGHRQGTVVSTEFINLLLENFFKTTRSVINDLLRDIQQGRHPGISITGFPDENDCFYPQGHTLLVDWVADLGQGNYRIYVYDSNRPHISGQLENRNIFDSTLDYCEFSKYPYIEVNTSDDSFDFLLGYDDNNNPIHWTRGCLSATWSLMDVSISGATLMRIPVSFLSRDDFTLPISLEGLFILFSAHADVTVSDEAGHKLSTEKVSNGIPGASFIPLPMGKEQRLFAMVLPANKRYQISVKGIRDRSPILHFSSEAGVQMALIAKPGSQANLGITPLGKAFKVQASSEGNFEGAIHFLVKGVSPARDLIPANGQLEDEEFYNRKLPVVNIFTLKGRLPINPVELVPYPDGNLLVKGNSSTSLGFLVLSSVVGPDNKTFPLIRREISLYGSKLYGAKAGGHLEERENPVEPSAQDWAVVPQPDQGPPPGGPGGGAGGGQEPPHEKHIDFCRGSCLTGAPVQITNGKLSAHFRYTAPVNILVGVLSEDFKNLWWLGESCGFRGDFAMFGAGTTDRECNEVSLPISHGYVFWMVTAEDLGRLDWQNGPYELLFYGF